MGGAAAAADSADWSVGGAGDGDINTGVCPGPVVGLRAGLGAGAEAKADPVVISGASEMPELPELPELLAREVELIG